MLLTRCNASSVLIYHVRLRIVSLRYASTLAVQPSKQDVRTIPGCITLLQFCAKSANLSEGKELHSWMLKHDLLASPLSVTSLINMYSKCNNMSYALSVFETSQDIRNVFFYNAIIAGFIANNLYEEGFKFYLDMRHQGFLPDKFTFPCAIKGCAEVAEVRNIHALLFKFGVETDEFNGSALVNCYLKFGAVNEAYQVFDDLPVRDVVLCNAMINGYVHIGKFRMALEVYRMMNKGVAVPNDFTATGVLSIMAMNADLDNGHAMHCFVIKKGYESVLEVSNALIDMYGKCNMLDRATLLFNLMEEKDIFSWNTLLNVHEQSGAHHKTLGLFHRMLDTGVKPDLVTLITVLPACPHMSALLHVKEIHRYMIVNNLGSSPSVSNLNNLFLNNALLDVYVKCGSMSYAYRVFDKMTIKDVASWNIMIMGYGMHGHGNEALHMFDLMLAEDIAPDEVTFVGVLSACSHSGFLKKGREYLSQMEAVYGLIPSIEHFACVIDMLGRAGQLDEAYELLVTIPVESNAVAWRSFLAACRVHGNAYLAEVAAKNLFELDPDHCGSYVLMSNVYGATGRFEEVSDLRLTMKGQNIQKRPGYSWLEVDNNVHVFVTGDRDHPESNSIYASLDSLIAHLVSLDMLNLYKHKADHVLLI